ncbi:hypothetical protein DFJ58DRAFT_743235 [Suillus subalutaceus]|uniref:uncharacterized protein n=1 Tax=Suillus subalutaceus TaxID=48586 RepID=UPI001B8743DA|nr:uncharacterized protein DFJ58DRAFT_743235 [Suillus subalutaceus]KAG1865898.1 hypothetical protein DFJ58DRAFT_743235 [Suillus subalutaceus]
MRTSRKLHCRVVISPFSSRLHIIQKPTIAASDASMLPSPASFLEARSITSAAAMPDSPVAFSLASHGTSAGILHGELLGIIAAVSLSIHADPNQPYPIFTDHCVRAKLDAVVPRLTLEDLTKLRAPEIDLQIRWHRRFDPAVPAAKDTPTTKQKKVKVLMEAVARYLSGEATPGGPSMSLQPNNHHDSAVASLSELGDGEHEGEDE